MRRCTVLSVFGTRPEAIKMAPLVQALQSAPWVQSRLCVTAQHRDMLDQVLQLFALTPDRDLNLMQPNQSLAQLTSRVLLGMTEVLAQESPDLVLVHGDTTTTMATSLACYYAGIPVGHVEAGLRTYNPQFPFPEELNRIVTDSVGVLHFAPTDRAVANLERLGASPTGIIKTGNTVIDALHYTLGQLAHSQQASPVTLEDGQQLLLVTLHRRENFGQPLQECLAALLALLERFPQLVVALPVHPNPNVKAAVEQALATHPRARLLPPQEYAPFCQLMQQATLIVTDSGGVQEEAPSLGKPVLVLRNETERPEAVEAGTVKLVGPNQGRILQEATTLLTDATAYQAMSRAINPYGDGQAVPRILSAIEGWWQTQQTVATL